MSVLKCVNAGPCKWGLTSTFATKSHVAKVDVGPTYTVCLACNFIIT